MLLTQMVPAESVSRAHYFLDFLDSPAVLAAVRIAAVLIFLGLGVMYLYARRKSRRERSDDSTQVR